jgi:hypothetical protein
MKRNLLYFVVLGLSILLCSAFGWTQCPEEPKDNGICDTFYVEVYPPDKIFTGPGHLVRVPMYVTHDVPNPSIDSIVAFLVPLSHTHTNTAKYCSISTYSNEWAFSGPELDRSIFRHLSDSVHNRFLDLEDPSGWHGYVTFGGGFDWPSFGLVIQRYPGYETPAWWEGSRVLFVTMTFRVEDTMTVCIDTCFWPPSDHLSFVRSDTVLYVPRHNLPYCFSISPAIGDVNVDGIIDTGDVVYLINYLFLEGPAPPSLQVGDTNCDGIVDIGDVIFLINYVFMGGSEPSC